ncbi:unnamed protein product [Leuciscus chuanchicus]
MTSLKNPQIVAFLEEEGVKIFDGFSQLVLCVAVEGITPDVSVKSSSVFGHEGDNVSVQCFYTSGYKDKLKQWCRYKDKSCYTEKRTDTSQNSSVQISDDGRSSFTVLMTGLRLRDSGWYFCSAGDLQVPVQLTISSAVFNKFLNLPLCGALCFYGFGCVMASCSWPHEEEEDEEEDEEDEEEEEEATENKQEKL